MPEPSSLPQAIPEEPTGPKSRLVIHKMALVNFKSYAGRQEIGPFHKVINNWQAPTRLTFSISAVVLFHRWSQRVGKIQYHRCSLIRIRIPRLQDEAGQDIWTHPQFCQLPRSWWVQCWSTFPRDHWLSTQLFCSFCFLFFFLSFVSIHLLTLFLAWSRRVQSCTQFSARCDSPSPQEQCKQIRHQWSFEQLYWSSNTA